MTKIRSRLLAAAVAFAALARPALAAPDASPRATPTPAPIVASLCLAPERAADLYSSRARREIRAFLRLRMLQLREEDLDRARAVVEGKLGVEGLFSPSPIQASPPEAGEKSCAERNDTRGPVR
jgi:hypothetical protein